MLLCRRTNKLEVGFTLIEMIVCFFLLSLFFLLLPRLNFIGIENNQSKGLNNWEWDVFLGQILQVVQVILNVILENPKPVDTKGFNGFLFVFYAKGICVMNLKCPAFAPLFSKK
ncbi:hypothetical protein BACERE00185_03121 [Bacillus mobilis]|uniref:Prepilin-type N-terminal cleavage/methylation domain-containing protein n=1 Tax=Bacillus mobilis TaxID=2026190 RepID=A0A1Y5ZXF1_9BACI|nr:hypothetical protein BACERE00185_03121 [Bacillus mobilis]